MGRISVPGTIVRQWFGNFERAGRPLFTRCQAARGRHVPPSSSASPRRMASRRSTLPTGCTCELRARGSWDDEVANKKSASAGKERLHPVQRGLELGGLRLRLLRRRPGFAPAPHGGRAGRGVTRSPGLATAFSRGRDRRSDSRALRGALLGVPSWGSGRTASWPVAFQFERRFDGLGAGPRLPDSDVVAVSPTHPMAAWASPPQGGMSAPIPCTRHRSQDLLEGCCPGHRRRAGTQPGGQARCGGRR